MIQFIVGDNQLITPLDGSDILVLPDCMKGFKLKIFKNGFGFLFEGVHYTCSYMGEVILIGTVFSNDEQWTIDLVC